MVIVPVYDGNFEPIEGRELLGEVEPGKAASEDYNFSFSHECELFISYGILSVSVISQSEVYVADTHLPEMPRTLIYIYRTIVLLSLIQGVATSKLWDISPALRAGELG